MFEGDRGEALYQFAIKYLTQIGSVKHFEEVLLNKVRPKRGERFDLRIRKPTESEEARNDTASYKTMQIYLAMSLGRPDIRAKWLSCIDRGGYDNLLKELEVQGPKPFIPEDKDMEIKGARGGIFWEGVIGYLKFIGQEGFNLLLAKINAIPQGMQADEMVRQKLLDIENTS